MNNTTHNQQKGVRHYTYHMGWCLMVMLVDVRICCGITNGLLSPTIINGECSGNEHKMRYIEIIVWDSESDPQDT
jgi:hypothetical protein